MLEYYLVSKLLLLNEKFKRLDTIGELPLFPRYFTLKNGVPRVK